jgi:hypothetical protein
MKKFDKIIIGSVLVLSAALFIVYRIRGNITYDKKYADIYINNEFYRQVILEEGQKETITVESKFGTNIITVVDDSINIKEADCPDLVCVKDGTIRRPGAMLVCLPNRLAIEIKGENLDDIDDVSH